MSEAAGKIKQGETLCTKALEDDSVVWEALMEGATIESIRENRHVAEETITAEKEDMKKLAKMNEIKRLHQEFEALQDRDHARETKVEVHQS